MTKNPVVRRLSTALVATIVITQILKLLVQNFIPQLDVTLPLQQLTTQQTIAAIIFGVTLLIRIFYPSKRIANNMLLGLAAFVIVIAFIA